jgi:protein TonB
MSSNEKNDINELIFEGRNKEYGAYILRKIYNKYLSISTSSASLFFILVISLPLIIAFFTPKEEAVKKKIKVIDYTQLSEPPSIDKKAPPPNVEAPPPLKSTMKFLPPVVKPDDQVVEEELPTQDELKMVDPGTKTLEGDPSGIDYSLIEVNEPTEEVVEEEKPEIFTFVEEMPSFPGGDQALLKFFSDNIVYPEIAKRAGVEGRVFLTFVVGKDGGISDVQVAKGIGAGCEEEAIRVLKTMPRWNPGKQNGNPVHVRISLPIVFKLQ